MTAASAAAVPFKFRLYIAGDTSNSTQALGNLDALCRERLVDLHEVDVVDVFLEPDRALEDCIFMTPVLVVLSPLPQRRIVGTLADPEVVARALGLPARPR